MPLYSLGTVSPRVPAADRYWLAPDAHVIGNVLLGEDVGIWFGAVLRGDNEPVEIGDRTNVQEHAMLHTDPGLTLRVGSDCTIGHRAILHGCTVGDGSLIGMGATVLNGAVIGAHSLVGANALVTEGKVFEPYSLIVGAPAKAIRTIDEATAERLLTSAAGYVANWKRFARDLKAIA
jgi:carbonic anhydrase/acetyltransferase-like protein (isoleucine patch superfamily)